MNKRLILFILCICMSALMLSGCNEAEDDAIVLRISNWEEYIDLGDWDEEETIDIDDDINIIGIIVPSLITNLSAFMPLT